MRFANSENPNTGWRLEHSYARLPRLFHTDTAPVTVKRPAIFLFNRSLAASLGLNPDILESEQCAPLFTGNELPTGARPLAQAYAGHQFGHFTTLGDGRAILLGEQLTPDGGRYDIQLKGSGPTPFSRGGDGRAALGPMLREYIISEAMCALGIPTTRSLAVATTGESVTRREPLPGAVLTRVAASHIRTGTFQWAAAHGDVSGLRALTDYTIQRHFPHLAEEPAPALALLKAIAEGQAALIAKWQHAGFIHGVMNTDNMAVSGETIDYGPCAFMDNYSKSTVFSSIDAHGRYAYGNQPRIAQWNLARLAEAMLPILHPSEDRALEIANGVIQEFSGWFDRCWLAGMRRKTGLFTEVAGDRALIESLLEQMEQSRADFTNTFAELSGALPSDPALHDWHRRWLLRLAEQPQSLDESLRLMRATNPRCIPRNHRVEEALEAAVQHGDARPAQRLIDALSRPFDYDAENEAYRAPVPAGSCHYQTFCGT